MIIENQICGLSIIVTPMIIGLFYSCTITTPLQTVHGMLAWLCSHPCAARIYALLLQALPYKYTLTPGRGGAEEQVEFMFRLIKDICTLELQSTFVYSLRFCALIEYPGWIILFSSQGFMRLFCELVFERLFRADYIFYCW